MKRTEQAIAAYLNDCGYIYAHSQHAQKVAELVACVKDEAAAMLIELNDASAKMAVQLEANRAQIADLVAQNADLVARLSQLEVA